MQPAITHSDVSNIIHQIDYVQKKQHDYIHLAQINRLLEDKLLSHFEQISKRLEDHLGPIREKVVRIEEKLASFYVVLTVVYVH